MKSNEFIDKEELEEEIIDAVEQQNTMQMTKGREKAIKDIDELQENKPK